MLESGHMNNNSMYL